MCIYFVYMRLITNGSVAQLIKVMRVTQSPYFTGLALSHQKMTQYGYRKMSLAKGSRERMNILFLFFFLRKYQFWKMEK